MLAHPGIFIPVLSLPNGLINRHPNGKSSWKLTGLQETWFGEHVFPCVLTSKKTFIAHFTKWGNGVLAAKIHFNWFASPEKRTR